MMVAEYLGHARIRLEVKVYIRNQKLKADFRYLRNFPCIFQDFSIRYDPLVGGSNDLQAD